MDTNIKIASVTMVKNESDIIELFVRYNLKFIDRMYIIDHMSVDKTLDILKLLKQEGLPITIMKYSSYAYDQNRVLTNITNYIKDTTDVDYIMFIDADELIGCKNKEDFSNKIINNGNESYLISEYNYYFIREDIDKKQPLYEKILYREDKVNLSKIMISVNLYKNRNFLVEDGGHKFSPGGEKSNSDIHLLHIPYRSIAQMKSKIIIGSLSYMIRDISMKNGYIGAHWFKIYKDFIDDNREIEFPTIQESDKSKYIYEPLKFNEEIIYTLNTVNCIENCISFFESILKYNDELDKYDIENMRKRISGDVDDDELIKLCRLIEKYITSKRNFSWKDSRLDEI